MAHSKRRAILTRFKFHRTASLAGAFASILLASQLPAMADPASNPAHAIANRFAEDAQRAEAQRKEAVRKQAQQRREQAARAKAQKAYESEMLRRARSEAEERRKLEEEAARLDAIRIERETREAKAARERAEKDRQIEAAQAAEKARLAEEAHKAEEAKRAAEALHIAAERAAAEEARKAEEARRAEVARKAEDEAKRAETQRLAEEARRAEQAAWAAEETRRLEEARKAEAIRKTEEARRLAAEQAAREEADKRAAEAQRAIARATAEETRRIADIEAEAEIARVAKRLRGIREEHLAQRTGLAADQTTGSVTDATPVAGVSEERIHEPSSGRGRIAQHDGRRDIPLPPPRIRPGASQPTYPHPETRLAFDGHVTVLLQMEPRYRRGRRYESMDPVICTTEGCYVSNGPEASASFLQGHRATRFGNAVSRRAGACNHAYTCVFRDVDVGRLPAELQPVDIRILRHDRRAPEWVEALSSCRVTVGDRLACTGAIEGDGYTMWVISEAAAERLPPQAFDHALADGIMVGARAAADPKLMGPDERW
jgi:colicin import membrane protein